MSQFTIVGGPEFILGFKLVGINHLIEVEENDNTDKKLQSVLDEGKSGILVIGQRTYDKANQDLQYDLENSVNPVVIVLSEESSQENLRKLIIKAIGIDVMNKEQN